MVGVDNGGARGGGTRDGPVGHTITTAIGGGCET